jgi:predicted AAA+ superfamily ATPase
VRQFLHRWYEDALRRALARPYVHILFGARQTGKTTLLRALVPTPDLAYDLSDPRERSRLLANPGAFLDECRDLHTARRARTVVVDEAQAVPALFDAVQHLYDADKDRWRFILCGSSARKLRASGANLLPGRSMLHRLYPLTMIEQGSLPAPARAAASPLPLPGRARTERLDFPPWGIEQRLAYGALPGIVVAPERDRAELLSSYAVIHLAEEIRRESLVRDWGAFARFLEFAARESGGIINYRAISQEADISEPTVKSYYQLLEDMFVGFRVQPFSGSARKNMLSTPRFFFVDLGVRHAAAGLTASPATVAANPGPLFEQWVGIELWKRLQYRGRGSLTYLRSKGGFEIDFIVDDGKRLIPFEVKWTSRPSPSDARHMIAFISDHRARCRQGYIVCRCTRPARLHDSVTAIPWQCL